MVNVTFLNPFIEAVKEVVKAELGIEVTRGPLSLQKSSLTADEVTVILSMVGEIQGVVLFGLSTQTALIMVEKMIGQKFSSFDNLAQSGIAELGNVITGRASINYSKAGYQTNISPPTLIVGKGIQISTLDFSRIVVPMATNMGELVINLALREATPGTEAQIPLAISNQ